MTFTKLAVAALFLALAATLVSSPAQAGDGTRDAYGRQASKVASWGGCKNLRARSNGGQYAASGLVCDLRGQRINILTFEKKPQEITWVTMTCTLLPDQWVMLGAGFVITAKDGNKAAAKMGERVYGGDPYRCDELV